MKKINILKQRNLIEFELNHLREAEKKCEEKFEELRKKCNHEIVISTWRRKAPDEMVITEIKPRSYCLFCSEHLSHRKYISQVLAKKISDSVVIDLQDYPNLCKYWENQNPHRKSEMNYLTVLERLYEDVKMDYPDISEQEIGMIMKKRLEVFDAFCI